MLSSCKKKVRSICISLYENVRHARIFLGNSLLIHEIGTQGK